jgi:GPH family glycoside/pentoside/hexuronide:cation symporter
VSWPRLLAFCVPTVGLSFYLMFVQFYFLKFATDVLLLAPAAIGALFGLGRIWDAISDPIAGYWSDRTRTRLGRRRPWMLAAVPLTAASFAMLWSPPAWLVGEALLAWSAVALLAFYTSDTVYSVPHVSLGTELTRDHHERTRVFGMHRVAFIAGIMLAFTGIQLVSNADDRRAAAGALALAAAAIVSLALLSAPVVLRERPENLGRGSASPLAALRDVARNPHARILLSVWFIESLGGGVLGVLAPYMTEYVMGRPDLIGVVPAFFVVPGILAVPLWIALSRRFGKREVWTAAMLGTGACFGATFLLEGEQDIAALCALLVGAGACFACGGTIGQSILADVIDYDELATGERKEGAYTAAFGLSLKLGVGTMVIVTGFALQLADFAPNQPQGETTRLVLRALFAGMPLLGYTIGAWIFRRFALGGDAHARIRSALDARAGGAPSG